MLRKRSWPAVSQSCIFPIKFLISIVIRPFYFYYNLYTDRFPRLHFDLPNGEVDPDGRVEDGFEAVVAEPLEKTRLSDCRVSDKDNFEEPIRKINILNWVFFL